MGSTTYQISRPTWLVDWKNTPRDLGHPVDWDSADPERANAQGKKYIPDGTIMALLDGGAMIPAADVGLDLEGGNQTGAETAVGLLIGEANESDRSDALTGYGLLRGGVVYENLLPDAEDEDFETWLGEMAANGSVFVYTSHVNSAAE